MKLNIQLFADASIVIGTVVDDKGVDKGLTEIEKKIKSKELDVQLKEENVKKAEAAFKDLISTLEQTEGKINDNKNKIKELSQELKNIEQADVVIGNPSSFDVQTVDAHKVASGYYDIERQIRAINSENDKLIQKMDMYAPATEKAEINYNKALLSLQKSEVELDRIKSKQAEVNKFDFSNIGKSLKDMIKTTAKWALAIFGVRSAYMGIRRAISLVQSTNENIAGQFNVMKTALANALLPVIKTIINFIAKLMVYINYIYSRLTGKNLFDFSKAFKDAKKNAEGTAKSAKQIKKELAGFDEMNVLGDNSSAGAGGGGANFDNPFKGAENIKIPDWLKWLMDHKNELIALLAGIGAGLLAFGLGFNALQSLGIGIAMAGIVYAIQSIIAFINDPSFENFLGIIKGIAIAVIGVAIAFKAWPVVIGAALALLVALVVEHFDTIKGWIDEGINWLDTHVLGGLRTLFGPLGDILYAPIKFVVEYGRAAFEGFFGGIKQVVGGIVKLFKGDFKGGLKDIFGGLYKILITPFSSFWTAAQKIISNLWKAFKKIGTKAGEVISAEFKRIINAVLGAIESIINFPIKSINKLIGVINKVPGINLGTLNTFNLPRLAKGGIINQPGRGIAVGGESGQEGVIPLTDSQQMALLGEAIGKYITINANITNTMNGRVISRELQKIQQENSFASNR